MAASPAKAPQMILESETRRPHREDTQPSVGEKLKLRLKRTLHEIFEGHEEYLGVTPD
jgi:hypothetical protein